MLLRGYFETEDEIGVIDRPYNESVEGECKNSAAGTVGIGYINGLFDEFSNPLLDRISNFD